MNSSTPSPAAQQASTGDRALVLGGGGSTGNAWLIGVVAGLYDAGLDVTVAERIIGTSAGSTAAAQVTGRTPPDLLADILDAPPPPDRPQGAPRGRASAQVGAHLQRTDAIIAAADDVADLRRRMGAAALELDGSSDATVQERWRTTVAARLPRQSWPDQALLITAVDAETGEPVVFDRDSGVSLVDAVAASCSSAFAFRIGDRRYVDGGYRTNADNADLAAGCGRVLVLSPLGGRSRTPVAWGTHLSSQVEALRAAGSDVVAVFPDADSGRLFGGNAMDLSLRPAAARAGRAQGRSLAGDVARLWG